ncbi:MAG: type II toxin-antitoxin system prevent-host-death family antitoxin [Candidatus Rokubacteria bacterium]|nr:type II toxin-antitoxin system prevent-host-death family antitoxin [Candidatus Rokubacteria bacterium]
MKRVGVYEAKTQLPRLLARVGRGERITITRHGVPVAELVPTADRRPRSASHVIAEIEEFRRGRSLGRASLRTLIRQGRR